MSWIDPDPDVRRAAVQRINEHVDFASEYGAPLAIGYIRGRQLDPDPIRAEEQKRLVLDCCCRCARYAEGTGVILAFEPINRYEVDYVHTIDEAIDFETQVDSPAMGIPADTCHMNIEEALMEDAFKRAGKLLSHIHLVDDNCLAPGTGHMDFQGLLGALQEAGYEGYLSLEVLPLPSPEEAASLGIAYVKGVLENLPQGGWDMTEGGATELVVGGHTIDRKMRVYSLDRADLALSNADRDVLRRLAGQVGELAARPIEDEKRDLWYRHNALEPTRPVIFCDPEDGWREIIPDSSLECQSQLARQWEMYLRKQIFWGEKMRGDYVIEPFFNLSHVYPALHWGLRETQIGGKFGGKTAIRWDAPVRSYDEDLPRLRFPEINIDQEGTDLLAGLAEGTLGDLLGVRVRTHWWWSVGLTAHFAFLRGLAQFMYDLVLEPENVHRLMSFLRDGLMSLVDYTEENNLLFLNNDGTFVGSGGFGFTRELPQPDFSGKVRAVDTWALGESQESVGVSPDMYGEFIFPYELPLLDRFGLNCYGCCEPIDKRWHVVSQIPRLRRVSVSAWADWARTAELLGDRYVFSMKPNPAVLAAPSFDEEQIRADLRKWFRVTRDCRVEAIMADNHTIQNDPERVIRWVRIAREEAERL